MLWGEVELEPEVGDWYLALDDEHQGRVEFHIDRLAQEGPLLDEPHSKQLDGKLRELRFYLGSRATRITYWIAPGRRIILLDGLRQDQTPGATRDPAGQVGDGTLYRREAHRRG